jgi:ATP-dependent Clp protease ATP-binding subunit ClpA
MLNWINRYLPVFIALGVALMLLQLLERHWPSMPALHAAQLVAAAWLRAGVWYVAGVSIVLWLVVIAVWQHAHDRSTWLAGLIPMDILDRLSNKKLIEEAAQKDEQEALLIDAVSLASALKAKVIGQDRVCEDLAQQVRRRMALTQRNRPVGVFLFAGPPGSGKTYLAKVIAEELDRKLLHFDMTQFSSGSHSASQLFGMTKGYVGSDTYGKLTASLRDSPAAVVLLDEIDKAHPEVLKGFLTAWNDGFITEASDGKHISTSKAIFVLTSNAATEALAQIARDFAKEPDELRKAGLHALNEAGFAPEVLNRLDRIFVFKQLEGLDVARVCAIEMETMIKGYGLNIVGGGIDPQIIIQLMQRYRKLGALASSRDLVRAMEEAISDSLIQAKQKGFDAIELAIDNGKVTALARRQDSRGSPKG